MNTISPTPTCSVPTISDPDAGLAYPSGLTTQTYSGGNATLNPGIYNGLNVASGATVTMNPGVYVITGGGTASKPTGGLVLGGTLTGNGVTLFLACKNFPTPCSTAGEFGALINKSGGSLTITQPTSGTYKGMSIFADRNNIATNTIDQGVTETVSGTWYTLRMPFAAIHANSTITVGNFIVDSFALTQNVTLNVTYIPNVSYTPPGGPIPLSRVALTQ